MPPVTNSRSHCRPNMVRCLDLCSNNNDPDENRQPGYTLSIVISPCSCTTHSTGTGDLDTVCNQFRHIRYICHCLCSLDK